MLRLSAGQFAAIARDSLVGRLCEQLSRYFPLRCAHLGAEGLRSAVQESLARGAVHDMRSEREQATYVHLSFMLGHGMDVDPRTPWVGRLLAEPRPAWERILAVRTRAMAYFDAVYGRQNEFLLRALIRLRKLTPADLRRQIPEDADVTAAVAVLQRVHPEKCRDIGDVALVELWHVNRAEARELGLSAREAQVWYALQFALGVAVGADPQHPWLARAVQDRSARRADANFLHMSALRYLDQMLRPSPGGR